MYSQSGQANRLSHPAKSRRAAEFVTQFCEPQVRRARNFERSVSCAVLNADLVKAIPHLAMRNRVGVDGSVSVPLIISLSGFPSLFR